MRACLLMSALALVLAWAFHTRQVAAAEEQSHAEDVRRLEAEDEARRLEWAGAE